MDSGLSTHATVPVVRWGMVTGSRASGGNEIFPVTRWSVVVGACDESARTLRNENDVDEEMHALLEALGR